MEAALGAEGQGPFFASTGEALQEFRKANSAYVTLKAHVKGPGECWVEQTPLTRGGTPLSYSDSLNECL